MPWAGRQQAKILIADNPAQPRYRQADPVLFMKPGAQITQSPAHHTMSRGNGAIFDPLRQSLHDGRCDATRSAPTMTINQTRRPLSVKAQNPVPNDLSIRSRKTGRFTTCRPVINRGKRQKAPGLAGMSASSGQTAHPRCVIVLSECDCLAHQRYLPSTMVSCESQFNAYGHPHESHPKQFSITRPLIITAMPRISH